MVNLRGNITFVLALHKSARKRIRKVVDFNRISHDRMSRTLCAILFLVLMIMVSREGDLSAASTQPPLYPEQFVGTWVGFTDDGYEFYKLLLYEDRKGLCAKITTGDSAVLYKIREWKVIQDRVHMDIEKVDESASEIEMKIGPSNFTRNEFFLYVRPKNASWEEKARLFNEESLQKKLNRAQTRIERELKK